MDALHSYRSKIPTIIEECDKNETPSAQVSDSESLEQDDNNKRIPQLNISRVESLKKKSLDAGSVNKKIVPPLSQTKKSFSLTELNPCNPLHLSPRSDSVQSPKGYTFVMNQIYPATRAVFAGAEYAASLSPEDLFSNKEAILDGLLNLSFPMRRSQIEALLDFIELNRKKLLESDLQYPLLVHMLCNYSQSFDLHVEKNGRFLIHFLNTKNKEKWLDTSGASTDWLLAWSWLGTVTKLYAYGVSKLSTEGYRLEEAIENSKQAQLNSEKYLILYNGKENFPTLHAISYLNIDKTAEKQIIVMERYATDLEKRMRGLHEKGRFSLTHSPFQDDKFKLRLFLQILKAVQLMHAQNHIHGDVKPENVLLDFEDNPYLTDFGYTGTVDEKRKETGTFCGSRSYLPFERYSQRRVKDPKAPDNWGLACILYLLILETSVPWHNAAFVSTAGPVLYIKNFFQKYKDSEIPIIKLLADMMNPHSTKRPKLDEVEKRINEIEASLSTETPKSFREIKVEISITPRRGRSLTEIKEEKIGSSKKGSILSILEEGSSEENTAIASTQEDKGQKALSKLKEKEKSKKKPANPSRSKLVFSSRTRPRPLVRSPLSFQELPRRGEKTEKVKEEKEKEKEIEPPPATKSDDTLGEALPKLL